MQTISRSLALIVLLSVVFETRLTAVEICVNDTLKVSHVQGRVVAPWNGGEAPIPNAHVVLRELRNDEWRNKYEVAADQKGFFRFESVPAGYYELDVASPAFRGFATMIRVKKKSKSKLDRQIVVVLEPLSCGAAEVKKIK